MTNILLVDGVGLFVEYERQVTVYVRNKRPNGELLKSYTRYQYNAGHEAWVSDQGHALMPKNMQTSDEFTARVHGLFRMWHLPFNIPAPPNPHESWPNAFGFHVRVLRPGEDVAKGLVAKHPARCVSVTYHATGTREATQYISMMSLRKAGTEKLLSSVNGYIAEAFIRMNLAQADFQVAIIAGHLLPERVIDPVDDISVQNQPMSRANVAKWHEVVVERHVPAAAIVGVADIRFQQGYNAQNDPAIHQLRRTLIDLWGLMELPHI